MNALGSAMSVAPGVHYRQTMPSARDGTRGICLCTLLERLSVLARDHRDEAVLRFLPLSKSAFGARTPGVPSMLLDEMPHLLALSEIGEWHEVDHRRIALLLQLIEFIEHERDPSAHPRPKIAPGAAEHDDGAPGHVLAAVVANSFDHCQRAAVADGEALACHTGEVRFPRGCAIQHGVADQHGLVGDELRGAWMPNDQTPA